MNITFNYFEYGQASNLSAMIEKIKNKPALFIFTSERRVKFCIAFSVGLAYFFFINSHQTTLVNKWCIC